MRIRKKHLFLFIFLLILISQSAAANLFIPGLEIITRGYVEDGLFKLAARGDLDFLIEGGYKFGGEIKLNIFSPNLLTSLGTNEELETTASNPDIVNYLNGINFLTFEGATIEIRELFGIDFTFLFFLGTTQSFCSGDIFTETFGIPYIGSQYRGYLYFPDAIAYEGIHTVNGIGIGMSSSFGEEEMDISIYAYQDGYLTPGIYSADFDIAFSYENLKIEFFGGATFPMGTLGMYRAGLMLYFKPGEIGEFLTEIGIPGYNISEDTFDLQLFYFLFEPRIHLGFMSIIPTFFMKPGFYLQEETGQPGAMDLNLNLQFGNPAEFPLSGGIEGTFSFGSVASVSFEALVSPYISFVASGVQWDIKTIFQVYPWSPDQLIEGFLGITAEF